MALLYVILILASTLAALEGRPTGAPADACVAMMPSHGGSNAQSNPGPFEVYHNIPNYFNRSTEYKVTLRTTDGSTFRGFFCQVRGYGPYQATSRPYGSFTTVSRTQTRDCSGQFGDTGVNAAAAITHTERLGVSNITFYWNAPAAEVPLPARLVVLCSTVVTFTDWYRQIPSATFTTDPNTAILTTVPPTMAATTPYPGTTPPAPGSCPEAAAAMDDAARYRAYLYCWSARFNEWNVAYQNWLNSGGQGCAPTSTP